MYLLSDICMRARGLLICGAGAHHRLKNCAMARCFYAVTTRALNADQSLLRRYTQSAARAQCTSL